MSTRSVVSAASALAAVSLAGAICLQTARSLVTPIVQRPERTRILAAGDGTVTLHADQDTSAPGVYSLYWSKRTGHARIGQVISSDKKARTVTRRVEKIYSGQLNGDTAGYWSGYVFPDPEAAGLPSQDVLLPGPAPAWLIPGSARRPWVIHVHGLGGQRATGLRTAPFFHRLGYPQLLISFRGDPDAPPTPDGKHHLGLSELADVEAALDYAATHGAGSIIISGWSMGATMALAAAHTSSHRELITGLVLTAPVLDWHRTLSSHTAARRLPAALATGVLGILGGPLHPLAGLAKPLDLRTLDYSALAPPVPAIILHSVGDTSTPIRISEDYAARCPDVVTLVRFPPCRHTQEWNISPGLWENAVEGWLHSNAGK